MSPREGDLEVRTPSAISGYAPVQYQNQRKSVDSFLSKYEMWKDLVLGDPRREGGRIRT